MFTYCFNNDFICIFISLLCILYFMMTNAATRISRFGTIKFYCIVLYCEICDAKMLLFCDYYDLDGNIYNIYTHISIHLHNELADKITCYPPKVNPGHIHV